MRGSGVGMTSVKDSIFCMPVLKITLPVITLLQGGSVPNRGYPVWFTTDSSL